MHRKEEGVCPQKGAAWRLVYSETCHFGHSLVLLTVFLY